jgi:Rrf2 family protein
MSSLVHVSEAASIALHACAWLARDAGRYAGSGEVCAALGFSPAHFAKVMRTLGRAGLVAAARGPGGGTRLARPAADIPLLEVYEAIEGSTRRTRCLLAPDAACRADCLLGRALAREDDALRRALARTTLADLARSLPPGRERAGPVRPVRPVRRPKGRRP